MSVSMCTLTVHTTFLFTKTLTLDFSCRSSVRFQRRWHKFRTVCTLLYSGSEATYVLRMLINYFDLIIQLTHTLTNCENKVLPYMTHAFSAPFLHRTATHGSAKKKIHLRSFRCWMYSQRLKPGIKHTALQQFYF